MNTEDILNLLQKDETEFAEAEQSFLGKTYKALQSSNYEMALECLMLTHTAKMQRRAANNRITVIKAGIK